MCIFNFWFHTHTSDKTYHARTWQFFLKLVSLIYMLYVFTFRLCRWWGWLTIHIELNHAQQFCQNVGGYLAINKSFSSYFWSSRLLILKCSYLRSILIYGLLHIYTKIISQFILFSLLRSKTYHLNVTHMHKI